ncbi:methyltransferase domain-containing protein [Amycolatopsis cihanbeyliensis]|uniref:Protein-L-isoaspartate O-methyltransferase n=1 Tax=Amycolatopsis cihanbeyliensis TaxID=1128664 RepID=A0A542CUX7_AMYCI|nr:methyltransferase domain-containing protein [Amycolatopsis cihanbeyliensis]TQI94628.1 protein-L-isoaspartate(D-aspartate) O-methyltransferase [Amycolatopsis cihanbeyliensis]
MTSADLIEELIAAGMDPAGWAREFEAVDRAAFIPARVWADDEHGRASPIDADADPARWRAAVYRDEPVVTQYDDGATEWPATSLNATSSASQPSIVLAMLDALDVSEGDRVLEIGTGTGYNTALLAERVGGENVISIEVDHGLAEQARRNLADAGYKVMVACDDGAAGALAGAPFDRVVCTAGVLAGQLPYAWVEQTVPDGLVLTPWGTTYRNGGLVRLTVHGDGAASGPIIGDAAFMQLREQRAPRGEATRFGDRLDASAAPTEHTTVPPLEIGIGHGAFTVGLRLPGVRRGVFYDDPTEVLLYHVPTGSVASVHVPDDAGTGPWPLRQLGPRRLWDEAVAAHAWWVGQGRPERTRYGVTVERDRQAVWLDEPGNIVA